MNEAELIRRAMSALGKRTSERKKLSSRKNAKRPRKKKTVAKPVEVLPAAIWTQQDGTTQAVATVYIDPAQFPKA